MGHDFIQIPPDSTGKKIRHTGRIDFELTNLTAVDFSSFERGDTVLGGTSGATAQFVGYQLELGQFYLHSKEGTGTFVIGETISIAGTDAGDISNFVEQHTPSVTISDSDNPFHRAKIDNQGSQYVRYSEGDLGFDAFGHAQFSQVSQMQSHTFIYGDSPEKFWDQEIGAGTVTAVPSESCILLSVDNQSGSKACRTTNQYYPYNPGEGNEILMSLRKGDDIKDGLLRRWGVFDDEDGIFFEQSGSVKSIVLRSSAGGSVTEEKVLRADLNGDGLDNSNTSEYLLDSTKYNLYWFDYQWLGVGKIRVGTFAPNGKRVTIHTFQNPNKKTLPWAKRGSLPIRWEMFNYAGTSGTSEMRVVCATVARQTDNIDYQGPIFSVSSNRTAVSGSVYTPLFTARPTTTFNGFTNRRTVIPTDIEVITEGTDPISVQVQINGQLTGSNFITHHPNSSTEVDLSSTEINNGIRFEELLFPAGVSLRELTENLDNALTLGADGVSQPLYTFAAKTVNPSGNANVTILVRWKEVS